MDSFTRFTVPALRLESYFDAISNSYDERRLKTDDGGSLFLEYARRYGTPIEECVAIDDADDVCAVFTTLGGKAVRVTAAHTTEAILDGLLLSLTHQQLPQTDG